MKIIISDKKVKIIDKEKLRTGNVNTYLIDVEYSDVYKDRALNLYFKNGDIKKIEQVGPNNVVKIPHEVLEKTGLLFIGIFSPNCKDNTLIDRYCSNLDTLEVTEGAYDKDATYTEELSPSILEQYLQEMKDFYNESIKEYNENALLETNKFNTNADNRKKEIDAVALNVEEDKKAIEKIQEAVELSEQSAKESADNAKISEQNAQNSLNKVTEIETNVTSIQEDINASKSHIDEQKGKVDKSVDDVEKLVEEATIQANISKEQAELSTTKAGQVSADKNAVESMKNEVSSMKTSVEQTKADAEQFKEETEQAKNETLEAKEIVKNSLETERNESDKKYARAIESDEIVIDGAGQVELDEDGFMKEFSAESNLPDITQKTRSGVNLYNVKDVKRKNDEVTIDENDYITMTADNTGGNSTIYKNYCTKYSDRFEPNHEYFLVAEILEVEGSGRISFSSNHDSDKPQFITSEYRDFNTLSAGQKIIASIYTGENNWMGLRSFATFFSGQSGSIKYRISILKDEPIEENFEYEPYGVSPSLENPSEFENVVKNVNISNSSKNFLNLNEHINALSNNITILDNNSYSTTYTDSVKWQGIFRFRFENLQKNKDYVISLDFSNNGEPYVVVTGDGETIIEKYMSYYPNGLTFNTNNYKRIQITIYANGNTSKSNTTITLSNIQLEQGKVKTDFSPFLFNDKYEIVLSEGQFLGNFNGYKNYIKDGKLHNNLKIYTLTGEESIIYNTTIPITNNSQFIVQTNLNSKKIDNIPLASISNYLKYENNYLKDEEHFYINPSGNIFLYVDKEKYPDVATLKAKLKELYDAGKPVQILYITNEEYEEDLSTENKSKINSLKVYNGVNNIESSCKITFKANKNLKNELDKCVKNTDYATNNKSGLIKGRATHGFNIDSLGAPYLSTYDEEYKNLPNSSFVSTGTLKKVEDKILSTSNNTYTKALKDGVVDKDFAQIYADNPKIDNLAIKGEQLKQRVRQGYNLLKYPYVSTTKTQHGVSITDNGDGSITLNGTSTAKIDFGYQWTNNLPNDFYTFITYGLPDTCYTNYYQVGPKYGESVGNFNKTATTENINLGAQLVIPEGVTLDNITIYPMLVKGQYTRETIPAWEQYGASPSLDYPSEIEITREQDIQTNKNNFCKGYENTTNSLKFFHALYVKGLKPSTTYTIAFKSNAIGNIYYINEELASAWLTVRPTGERQVFTFKTRDDITKAYIPTKDTYTLFKNSIDQPLPNEFEEVMLVEGTHTAETMPEYEPFEGEEYNVILPEGDFNNAIGEYSDKILADDKQKKFIKELVLTGEENWSIAYPTITSEEFQSYMLNVESFVNTWLTGKGIMSNCFLNVMGDIVFYKTERGICSDDKGHLVICTNILNIEEFKTKLKELHEAGTPVKIYYATEDPKIIDLPEGTVPKIELMDGLNNISIDKGTMSFEYNKSLARAFEEEREEKEDLKTRVSNLENQILELLGGN